MTGRGLRALRCLSHAYWERRFAARRDAIGRHIALDDTPYEIIGVMPPGFQFPSSDADLWTPVQIDPTSPGDYWGAGVAGVFVRLHSGITPAGAQAELEAWIPRLRAMFPWRMPDPWGAGARLLEMKDYVVSAARVRSLALLGVVALVLLIAVVNVANLLIGQGAARQGELLVRASLGAGPGRLMRQLLTEAAVLAVSGGLLGVALAFGQLALLKRFLPPDTPRLSEVAIDGRVLAFAAAISLGSALLFGSLPAWRVGKRGLAAVTGGRATLRAVGFARRRRPGRIGGRVRYHPARGRGPVLADLVVRAGSGHRFPRGVRRHRRNRSAACRFRIASEDRRFV